jgi:hypothetical protein
MQTLDRLFHFSIINTSKSKTQNNENALLTPFGDSDSDFNLNVNNQSLNDLEAELEKFRSKWKKELLERDQCDRAVERPVKPVNDNGNEKNAMYLFNKGVVLEQQGRHYEGKIQLSSLGHFPSSI